MTLKINITLCIAFVFIIYVSNSNVISVTNAQLKDISEKLLREDSISCTRFDLDLQTKGQPSKRDEANRPLFTSPYDKSCATETMEDFMKLLDNYNEDVRNREDYSKGEKKEKDKFLDSVVKTRVMKSLGSFLKKHNIVRGSLRQVLDEIWFTAYPRDPRQKKSDTSSGFEHVFMGEIKNGKVSGYHNWLKFREDERNNVNYKGYLQTLDLGKERKLLKLKFSWNRKEKSTGSFFVGTSPELEMAYYTLCFLVKKDKSCNLKANGKRFRIKIHLMRVGNKNVIGSAFPIL